MKEIKLTRGFVALVDDEDFEALSKYKWHAAKSGTRQIRAQRSVFVFGAMPINILMHRQIMGITGCKILVDHKDGNALNNQKSNLRICTHKQNNQNKQIPINNTSGFKGVSFHQETKKWRVRIKLGGKITSLGLFHDKKEAALAYNAAAIKYFGEFAWLNKV